MQSFNCAGGGFELSLKYEYKCTGFTSRLFPCHLHVVALGISKVQGPIMKSVF